MKVHLNKILRKLNSTYKAPEKVVFSASAELKRLKEKLSKTNKTNYTKKLYSINSYALNDINLVTKPGFVSGDFIVIGSYNVVKTPTSNYKQNQLISKSSISKLKISLNKLYLSEERLLIENKQTKKMYLVDQNFLNIFSIKK